VVLRVVLITFKPPEPLQRNAGELVQAPSERLPWNSREMIGRTGSCVDSKWSMMNPT
jgi:hypothetical protein